MWNQDKSCFTCIILKLRADWCLLTTEANFVDVCMYVCVCVRRYTSFVSPALRAHDHKTYIWNPHCGMTLSCFRGLPSCFPCLENVSEAFKCSLQTALSSSAPVIWYLPNMKWLLVFIPDGQRCYLKVDRFNLLQSVSDVLRPPWMGETSLFGLSIVGLLEIMDTQNQWSLSVKCFRL